MLIDSRYHGQEYFQVKLLIHLMILWYNVRFLKVIDQLKFNLMLTDGTGKPNPHGIEYYNNLIDSLLEKG